MKKSFLFLVTVLSIFFLSAQDAKIIFNAEKIVFYGLDFTKAKFALPDAKPDDIKNNLFKQWNDNVFSDNGRFNKESAFKKLTVYGEPSVVEKRNATVNASGLTEKYEKPLAKTDIQNVISEYLGGTRKDGLGVVFIVESFSKKDKKGIADVVFFDIASHKVLLSKQMTGEPRGGGLNNFWMGAIQVMFDNMANGEFEVWKKEVTGK